MPGDTDISHAVEERLLAIEARLDELEGNKEEPEQLPEEEESTTDTDEPYDPSKPIETTTSRRGGRRTYSNPVETTETTE